MDELSVCLLCAEGRTRFSYQLKSVTLPVCPSCSELTVIARCQSNISSQFAEGGWVGGGHILPLTCWGFRSQAQTVQNVQRIGPTLKNRRPWCSGQWHAHTFKTNKLHSFSLSHFHCTVQFTFVLAFCSHHSLESLDSVVKFGHFKSRVVKEAVIQCTLCDNWQVFPHGPLAVCVPGVLGLEVSTPVSHTRGCGFVARSVQ